MKKAEKVEMKVMATERSRLPPNITVQMLEAPPPGLQPIKLQKKEISLPTANNKINKKLSTQNVQ